MKGRVRTTLVGGRVVIRGSLILSRGAVALVSRARCRMERTDLKHFAARCLSALQIRPPIWQGRGGRQ